MPLERLPLEILIRILVSGIPGDAEKWIYVRQGREYVSSLRSLNSFFNKMVTESVYGRLSIMDYAPLSQKISSDGLGLLLYEKEKNANCNNILMDLLRRFENTLSDLCRGELKHILSERQQDIPGWTEKYVRAFIAGMIAYMGKSALFEHFFSRNMTSFVSLHGSSLGEIDLVALAALFQGDQEVLNCLLDSKKTTKSNEFYFVALYLAAHNGDVRLCEFILEKSKFEPEVICNGHRDILECAARNGHTEIVKLLLKGGVDVDNCNTTALHAAAGEGHGDIVTMLMEAGVDVNAKNEVNETPLQMASDSANSTSCNVHYLAVMRALIDKGATVDASGERPSALQAAARNGNRDAVDLLLKAGADPNTKSQNAFSALILAIKNSGDIEIVKLLLESGADLGCAFKRDNPLIAAIKSKNEALFDFFLEDSDPNITDAVGTSALYFAAAEGHVSMVRKLLNKGAKVAANSGTVLEPIMGAAAGGNGEAVDLLCQYGAGISSGALYAASRVGRDRLVNRLIHAGADIHRTILPLARDLPLHAALSQGHESTIKLLLGAGATCISKHLPVAVLEAASNKHFDAIKLVLKNCPVSHRLHPANNTVSGSGNPIPLLLMILKAGVHAKKLTQAWTFIKEYDSDIVNFMEYVLSTESKVTLPNISPAMALKAGVESQKPTLVSFFLSCYKTQISDHTNTIEIAVRNRDIPMLDFLLGQTAAPESPNHEEWEATLRRAVDQAVQKDSYPMVEMLMSVGAFKSVSTVDEDGNESNKSHSLIDTFKMAMEKKNESIMRLLISHGAFDQGSPDELKKICSTAAKYRYNFVSESLAATD